MCIRTADSVEKRMVKEFHDQVKVELEQHDCHSLYWARYYDLALGEVYDREKGKKADNGTVIVEKEEKAPVEGPLPLSRQYLYRVTVTPEMTEQRINEWLYASREELEKLERGEIPVGLYTITQIEKKPKKVPDKL